MPSMMPLSGIYFSILCFSIALPGLCTHPHLGLMHNPGQTLPGVSLVPRLAGPWPLFGLIDPEIPAVDLAAVQSRDGLGCTLLIHLHEAKTASPANQQTHNCLYYKQIFVVH